MWYNNEIEVDLDDLEEDGDYNNATLSAYADALLRQDSKTELCRKCEKPGEETGKTELAAQYDEKDDLRLDDDGNQLFLEFAELVCGKGHRWYRGEGKDRGIAGKNPILFEEHLQSRRRREIYTTIGTPDPSIVQGSYNRSHPSGRKINSSAQRKKGSSYYRAYHLLPIIYAIIEFLN
jgi:hypothetical protein